MKRLPRIVIVIPSTSHSKPRLINVGGSTITTQADFYSTGGAKALAQKVADNKKAHAGKDW